MAAFSALLFDLDGTIIDSAPDVCASVNRVLETMDRPSISVEDTKMLVGFGARTLVEKTLEMTGQPGSEKDVDFLLSGFLESYRRNPSEHTVLFPGARAALDRFVASNMRLGICTNKPTATCFPVLEALDLGRYFDTVICGDTLEFRKPDPRHVFHTLDDMQVTVDEAAFIGDSEADIEAANSAGMPSVLVTFGYCHVPLDSLDANALIDHFDELDEALEGIKGGG
ncbi:MAG: phosphoglycolate phosphatase [Rhodospirillales bacterium]|nr:phosphoglycolate phosphatase [Rhodospirillales bacterium]